MKKIKVLNITNDKEVRARDVQTFFADLSTGAHSPSLISQGRIGQLVTAKPIERKSILEEAAGISLSTPEDKKLKQD